MGCFYCFPNFETEFATATIIGICGNLLPWFSSYLRDRKQRVVIDGFSSPWLHVTSLVLQGSILGLFLFLLFINDLPASVYDKSLIFADDTKLYLNTSKIGHVNCGDGKFCL